MRNKNITRFILLIFISTVVSGCSFFQKQESLPSSVTIDEAMKQIGQGFRNLREELDGQDGQEKIRTGLVPTETVITFKLTESKSGDSKLAIDLSNPVITSTNNKGGSVSAGIGSASAYDVGNTISIKLVSSLDYLSKKTKQSCITSKDEKDKDLKKCSTVTTNVIDKEAVDAYQAWLNIGNQMYRVTSGGIVSDVNSGHHFFTVGDLNRLNLKELNKAELMNLQENFPLKIEEAIKAVE